MRRIIGLVMVGLGVCLIALAIVLPTWVYPRIAKIPENPNQYVRAVGTGITALVPSDVVNGGNGIYPNQTVQATRRVEGQIPPNGSTVPKGQAFYRVAFQASVINNPKFTGLNAVMEAYVEGGSINGRTGDSTNCCGDYLALDKDKPAGDRITHQGLQFKFPFGVKQGQNYPFWDVNIKAATLARYDGTEKIDGLQTYRFIQSIKDEKIGTQDVPGALFGDDAKQSVTSERIYATIRTIWVEPYTGAIIKGSEQVNQRLSYNGREVPIIRGTLTYDDATIKGNVKNYKLAAFGLKFVTKIGPIGGWILGPIFALIGLTMLAISRRGDWEDEWDDDYDDDDYDDDDDDDDEDEADAKPSQRVK